MNNDEKKYLLDLHKENSVFLNMLLSMIPLVFSSILLCFDAHENNRTDFFFSRVSLIAFILSLTTFLISFVVSDKAIDCIASAEERVQAKGWSYNHLSKWLNNIVLILNVLGLVFLTISFVIG